MTHYLPSDRCRPLPLQRWMAPTARSKCWHAVHTRTHTHTHTHTRACRHMHAYMHAYPHTDTEVQSFVYKCLAPFRVNPFCCTNVPQSKNTNCTNSMNGWMNERIGWFDSLYEFIHVLKGASSQSKPVYFVQRLSITHTAGVSRCPPVTLIHHTAKGKLAATGRGCVVKRISQWLTGLWIRGSTYNWM